MSRQSYEGRGVSHLAEIPAVTRVGPLVASSVIPAFNPGTRTLPDDEAECVANLFRHIDDLLTVSGTSRDNLAKVDFYLPGEHLRGVVDGCWRRWFATRTDSPARHIHIQHDGKPPHCAFIAFDTAVDHTDADATSPSRSQP